MVGGWQQAQEKQHAQKGKAMRRPSVFWCDVRVMKKRPTSPDPPRTKRAPRAVPSFSLLTGRFPAARPRSPHRTTQRGKPRHPCPFHHLGENGRPDVTSPLEWAGRHDAAWFWRSCLFGFVFSSNGEHCRPSFISYCLAVDTEVCNSPPERFVKVRATEEKMDARSAAQRMDAGV